MGNRLFVLYLLLLALQLILPLKQSPAVVLEGGHQELHPLSSLSQLGLLLEQHREHHRLPHLVLELVHHFSESLLLVSLYVLGLGVLYEVIDEGVGAAQHLSVPGNLLCHRYVQDHHQVIVPHLLRPFKGKDGQHALVLPVSQHLLDPGLAGSS